MRTNPWTPMILAAAAAIAIGCGGSSSGSSTTGTTAGATVNVSIPNGTMTFSPQDAPVHGGDIVRWTNNDSLPHTVASDTGVANLNSDPTFPGGMANGDHFSWTVPTNAVAGAKYFYHCKFHGSAGNGTAFGAGMVGVLTVQ